jgi:hypothetical protein
LVKPEFTAVQPAPLFVERKTPPPEVPANRFVPATINVITIVFVRPEFTAVQLEPLFVETKIPPPELAANKFVPATANAETLLYVRPDLTDVQFVPLFVERKTPLKVPANKFVPPPPSGLTANARI